MTAGYQNVNECQLIHKMAQAGEQAMRGLNSHWLAEQMVRVLDAPNNAQTVLTQHVNMTSTHDYVRAVQQHIEARSSGGTADPDRGRLPVARRTS